MKGQTCLSAEAIADLIRGASTDEEARHVQACPACSRRVGLLRRVVSAGVDQVAQSVAEVDDLIRGLMDAPRKTWWRIVRTDEYERADVARRLLTLAIDARLRDPVLSIDYSTAAAAVADQLASEVPDLRFETWKFLSAVLRESGRFAETEAALQRAEAAAATTSEPEMSRASVLLSRALYNAEPDVWRPDEAATQLDQAEQIFAADNTAKQQAVLTARGMLLYRLGDLRAASRIFTQLLDATTRANREAYLNALSNLAWAQVELREVDGTVADSIDLLIDENLALGRTVQVVLALWMKARITAARGHYDEAVELFTAAMAQASDSDTYIRVGLDATETLLLAERHQEALQVARELAGAAMTLDQQEPSRRRALTAQVLGYLREAAQREIWTADLVADLARYVDRITRQRPFAFVPPMPLADM